MKQAALFLIIALAIAPLARATTPPGRSAIEITTGKGYIAPVGEVIKGDAKHIRDTQWIDFKIRPYPGLARWEAIGVQIGAHQSSDFTKTLLCSRIPSIAGRIYCGTAEDEARAGTHASAIYTGVHAEMIELLTKQPQTTLVFLGAGETAVQTITRPRQVLPYGSLEISYRFTQSFEARASIFISLAPTQSAYGETYGMSTPNLTLEYRY